MISMPGPRQAVRPGTPSSAGASKTFPFSGSGLASSHAVIRYRQPGQLDGSRERGEHRQQGVGQPLRFQGHQCVNRARKERDQTLRREPLQAEGADGNCHRQDRQAQYQPQERRAV